MKYTYYLTYSCYDNKMQILLNGEQPLSSNSSVLQYMDEPFYCWHDKIFDVLYRELDEDYQVVYMGRPEEAAILRQHVKKTGGCVGLEERAFSLNQTLQERMLGLSKLMKLNKINADTPIQMKAVFLGGDDMIAAYQDVIGELQIKNQYCSTDFAIWPYASRRNLAKTDIPFFLAQNEEEAEKMADNLPSCKYAFILVENMTPGFIKAEGNVFFYGIGEDSFEEIVYECFLLFPLSECFSTYTKKLLETGEPDDLYYKMKTLISVKPVVRIEADGEVELGCSLPFSIQMYPAGSDVPELVFEYQLNGIVKCTQEAVIGEKAGKTKVRVYEKGSTELIGSFVFTVYKRNRITSFLLSDHKLSMGIGDYKTISYDYMPSDADNTELITWTTSNPQVAQVDKEGRIHAVGAGRCQIVCAAEQVTSRCDVTVKPYLQEIILPECIQSGTITMNLEDRMEIACTTVPSDFYDGPLVYGSSNLMVANVENTALVAVSSGEADITIESRTGRIRKVIHVVVNKKKTKPKKRGLFGLFG